MKVRILGRHRDARRLFEQKHLQAASRRIFKQKGAPEAADAPFLELAGHGAEAPKLYVKLSGDPSEVTALQMRH